MRLPITDYLRANDIPVGLTHTQVDGVRILANLVAIITRTLMDKDIIVTDLGDPESQWDLEAMVHAVEQLGGSFTDPDIDNVEVA
ncbi:MAG: hypothetical protein WC364_05705 [Eubacteriales bacterium]